MKRVGGYELERRLGAGGMGEVFLARREEGARVVLKRVLPALAAREGFGERFLHEVRVLARLSHPNIVRVLEFFEAEGTWLLAMEHVEGEDLASRLARGALSTGEFARLALGAARALEAAHSLRDASGRATPVIHRDVSPHNFLLDARGEPKLIDFGVASLRGEGESGGKLAWAAPEQLLNDETSAASDQYSLGVTLWACLAGRPPFDAEDDVEVIRLVTEVGVEALPPGPFTEVVMRMCALEPRARFGSMREVVSALEQVARALRLELAAPPAPAVAVAQSGLAQVKPQAALNDVERAALAALRDGMTTEEAEAAIDAAGLEGAPFALDVLQALIDAGAISTSDRDGARVICRV